MANANQTQQPAEKPATPAIVGNNFDFTAYNEIMKPANSGLKLFIAGQLMSDVEGSMRRFRSPLAREVANIVDEIGDIRRQNKELAAKAQNTTPAPEETQGEPTKTTDYTDAPALKEPA